MPTSRPIEVREVAIVRRLFRQAHDEAARLAEPGHPYQCGGSGSLRRRDAESPIDGS